MIQRGLFLTIMAGAASTFCGSLSAQTKSEYLFLTNRDPTSVEVWLRASDAQGNKRQWFQVQPARVEPFDVAIRPGQGLETAMLDVPLCSMMQACARDPLRFSNQVVPATTRQPGTKKPLGQSSYSAAVAWDTVDIDFQSNPGVQTLLRPTIQLP
jgi:hypothetical protein